MKTNFLLVIVFLSMVAFALKVQYPTGIVGLTEKDGAMGCICHNFEKSDSVSVWIEGPDSLVIGSSAEYKLFLFGGPAVEGGFNLAALIGKVFSVDSLTQRMEYVQGDTQLTHTQPLNFVGDTIFWRFVYEAPDSVCTDTLYSVGNSVNGDGIPSDADHWNFGRKFVITIYDSPIKVDEKNLVVNNFILYQNYPNPFNPSTKISWQSPVSSHQTLKVFDALGNEVATLVDEYKPAGKYEVEFSDVETAHALSLPSGVYIYQLKAGEFTSSKKMIMIK
ncbi:MAG: choice-of-anchor V domain-containing protein [Ignavibacterium sp.]